MKNLILLFTIIAILNAQAQDQFDPVTFPYLYPSAPWLNQNFNLQATNLAAAQKALGVSGTNSVLYPGGSVSMVNPLTAQIYYVSGVSAVDIGNGYLRDLNGNVVFDFSATLGSHAANGQWDFNTTPTVIGNPVFTNGASLGSASLQSSNVFARVNQNLFDLTSASTARANLGLDNSSVANTNTMTVFAATNSSLASLATNLVSGSKITNSVIAGAAIYGSTTYPSNFYTLTGHYFNLYNNVHLSSPDGGMTGLKAGDDIVITNLGGNIQVTLVNISGSNALIKPPQSFVGTASNVIIYPAAIHAVDINGVQAGWASANDGGIGILGGGNSGKLVFGEANTSGANTNSLWWIQDVAETWSLCYETNGLAQNPNVFTVDPQNGNNYESLRIRTDGTVAMRTITNTPGNGLGYLPIQGNVDISSNLTVRTRISGNGSGITNLSTAAMPYRSGQTNMPNLATSAAITFATPLNPNVSTNYIVTFEEEGSFAATSFAYASARTTNGFTLNLTTGITGGGYVGWRAAPLTETNGVSVGY